MYKKQTNVHKLVSDSIPKPFFRLTKKQVEGLKSVSEVIIALAGMVGVVSLTMLAPNMLSVLPKIKKLKRIWSESGGNKQKRISEAFYYLKRSGVIVMRETGEDVEIELTEKGKRKFDAMSLATLKVNKEQAWNKKWWQVAADIPTKSHRHEADALRSKLKQMNFFPLQRSLWFYPFDPRAELEYLLSTLHISEYVTVMEICRMDVEDEKVLKKHFKNVGIL